MCGSVGMVRQWGDVGDMGLWNGMEDGIVWSGKGYSLFPSSVRTFYLQIRINIV